jgi:chemotaxis protein methyltransferase CheR
MDLTGVNTSEQREMREFVYTLADFNVLRALSNQHSGIMVPDDKFDMFYSRLAKRVRLLGLTDFAQYCQYLQNDSGEEFTQFINAITTNLTAFFREKHHFDFLGRVLIPELLKKNKSSKQIKVWSAGCSTGEEPYSIAMTFKENLPSDWEVKILATDLDTQVLSTASAGIYHYERLTGVDEQQIKTWFQRGVGTQANKVRVKSELRELIRFRHLNLMNEWPMSGFFDAIFCRNVLIYFDKETKFRLVGRYAERLKEGSHLFIGHSESLYEMEHNLELIGKTIYKKVSR